MCVTIVGCCASMLDGLLGSMLATLTGGERQQQSTPSEVDGPAEKRRKLEKHMAFLLANPKGSEKSMQLSGVQLERIPDVIWDRWTHLRHLDLSVNRITRIPRRIRKMRRLQRLALGKNQLRELPDELGQLALLQWLDFTHNHLTCLPETLVNLPRLTSLGASDCQFTTFPPVICQMVQLRKLGFFANLITELPRCIGNLNNLTKLDLSGNCLTSLPAEIGLLTQLTWLNLSNNRLETLPSELGNLTSLCELGLSGNRLTRLPDLSGLKQLTLLPLYNNCLQHLDDWIGQLPLLTQLEVSGNQLTQLPDTVWSSPALQVVNLRSNRLTSLPDFMGDVWGDDLLLRGCHPHLHTIDVRDNQLSILPWSLLGPRITDIKAASNPWDLEYPLMEGVPAHQVSLFNRIALNHNTPADYDHLKARLAQLKPRRCQYCLGRFLHQPFPLMDAQESNDGIVVPFLIYLCSPECAHEFHLELEERLKLSEFETMEVTSEDNDDDHYSHEVVSPNLHPLGLSMDEMVDDLDAYYGPPPNASQ